MTNPLPIQFLETDLEALAAYAGRIALLVSPDEDTARQLLDCAALHARAADGSLVRDQRPERLRRGMLARLPPSGQAPTASSPISVARPVSETP